MRRSARKPGFRPPEEKNQHEIHLGLSIVISDVLRQRGGRRRDGFGQAALRKGGIDTRLLWSVLLISS